MEQSHRAGGTSYASPKLTPGSRSSVIVDCQRHFYLSLSSVTPYNPHISMSRTLIIIRWPVCAFVLLLFLNPLAQAATVTSLWNVIFGNWAEATNWTHSPANVGADYPNDDALTYDVRLTSGSVVLEQPVGIQKFEFAGGALSNASTLQVADEFGWTSGTLSGPGTVMTMNTLWAEGGTNESTVWIAALDANVSFTTFDHRGTIILDNWFASMDDSVISGRFIVGTNGHIGFGGTNHFVEGSLVRGPGRISVSYLEGTLSNACRMSINGPSSALDGPGRFVLSEDALFTVRHGSLRGQGSVEIGPQASMLFEWPSTWTDRRLTNYGTCLFSNVFISAGSPTNSALLHNYGRVDFYSSFLGIGNSLRLPTVINHGLLCFTNDWETQLRGNITNHGSVEMFINFLSVSNFVNFGAATLFGFLSGNRIENRVGTMSLWSVSGLVTNNATLDGSGFSVQGSFHQSSNGVLRLRVHESVVTNGPAVRITGDALFDGTLQIRLTNGFQPSLGQRLRLITNSSAQGFFRRIDGLELGNGLRLAPEVTANTFDLVVVEATNASTASLIIERTGAGLTLNASPSLRGFFLQSATNLANPDWQTFDFAGTNTLSINTTNAQFFIRARDPACCD